VRGNPLSNIDPLALALPSRENQGGYQIPCTCLGGCHRRSAATGIAAHEQLKSVNARPISFMLFLLVPLFLLPRLSAIQQHPAASIAMSRSITD
jgi:hypothetical protein